MKDLDKPVFLCGGSAGVGLLRSGSNRKSHVLKGIFGKAELSRQSNFETL